MTKVRLLTGSDDRLTIPDERDRLGSGVGAADRPPEVRPSTISSSARSISRVVPAPVKPAVAPAPAMSLCERDGPPEPDFGICTRL